MSQELKYHYSNPKFDGLPWPADKKTTHKQKRSAKCVKKIYAQQEAQKETVQLRKDCPGFDWFYQFCNSCQGFHISRET